MSFNLDYDFTFLDQICKYHKIIYFIIKFDLIRKGMRTSNILIILLYLRLKYTILRFLVIR